MPGSSPPRRLESGVDTGNEVANESNVFEAEYAHSFCRGVDRAVSVFPILCSSKLL